MGVRRLGEEDYFRNCSIPFETDESDTVTFQIICCALEGEWASDMLGLINIMEKSAMS